MKFLKLSKALFTFILFLSLGSCSEDDPVAEQNSAPVISNQSFNVSEAATDTDVFGKVVATDPDGDEISFSISSNDNDFFGISSTGQLSLLAGKSLDFETQSTFMISVEVTDGMLNATAEISINVIDVDENAAPVISEQSFSIPEDIDDTTVIGSAVATDPDEDVINFTIITDPSDLFEITTEGEISLNTGKNLDFETVENHELVIQVSDGSLTATSTIFIIVENVNEAPSFSDQSFSVAENIDDLTIIGLLQAMDPEEDNLTFNIISNDNDLFEITEASKLSLVNGKNLDYELSQSHDITVEVSDGTLNSTATVTINVSDVIVESQGFVTKWETTLASESITIPTNVNFSYDYTVDWGDGTISENLIGDASHTYENPGIYYIAVTGVFPSIFFNNTGDKTKIKEIVQWGNIAWKSMEGAFHGCTYLTSVAADIPDLSQVTSMASMFNTAYRYQFDDLIGQWNVGNVTDMTNLFKSTSFNKNINGWDVSNVNNMAGMFEGAADFNQNLNNWDVSSVTNMSLMFSRANSFNQDLNNWNVGNVTDMSWMFYKNESFNGSINSWNVSKVTTMRSMFEEALAFNKPLDNWNINSLSNVINMFAYTQVFNQDISAWNINNGSLNQLGGMFKGAIAFNQNLSAWDVSNIIFFSSMFEGASSFDQNLGSWSIVQVENGLGDMLDDTALSLTNYNATLVGWSQQNIVYENTLGANGLKFCNDGESARDVLISKGWTFNGDSKETTTCP